MEGDGFVETVTGQVQISSIGLFLSYERVITRAAGMADGPGNLSRSAFDITAVGAAISQVELGTRFCSTT